MAISQLTSWIRTPQKTRRDSSARLHAERLEDRTTPTTFTVNWDGSAARPVAALTLQDCINLANANPGPDNIIYGNNPVSGAPITQSIVLSAATGVGGADDNGPLPTITGQLTIDGFTTIGGGSRATVNLTSTGK